MTHLLILTTTYKSPSLLVVGRGDGLGGGLIGGVSRRGGGRRPRQPAAIGPRLLKDGKFMPGLIRNERNIYIKGLRRTT